MQVGQYEYLVGLSFTTQENGEIGEFSWVAMDTSTFDVIESVSYQISHSNQNSTTDSDEGIPFQQAIQKFDTSVYVNFISVNKSFCIVCENSWDMRKCFLEEALRNEICIAPHYTRFFDLLKEFKKTNPNASVENLHEMCDYLHVIPSSNQNKGLEACQNMVLILEKLLISGHKFVIPEIILSIFQVQLEEPKLEIPTPTSIPIPIQDPQVTRASLEPQNQPSPSRTTTQSKSDSHSHSRDEHRHDDEEEESCVVRARGLPWQAREGDLMKFFKGISIIEDGILIEVDSSGKNTGEAYIQFENPSEVARALKLDRKHIGHRYIELFPSTLAELEVAKSRNPRNQKFTPTHDYIIKIRGLSFSTTEGDILHLLRGIKIPKDGIHFILTSSGKPTGDAFVELYSEEDVKRAFDKVRDKGSRYMEAKRASKQDILSALSTSVPRKTNLTLNNTIPPKSSSSSSSSRSSRRDSSPQKHSQSSSSGEIPEHFLRLQGLPPSATEVDIMNFFSSVNVIPIGVQIIKSQVGRSLGEGFVQLQTQSEANKGLTKSKHLMLNKSIEVTPSTTAEVIAALENDQPSSKSSYNSSQSNYHSSSSYNNSQTLPPSSYQAPINYNQTTAYVQPVAYNQPSHYNQASNYSNPNNYNPNPTYNSGYGGGGYNGNSNPNYNGFNSNVNSYNGTQNYGSAPNASYNPEYENPRKRSRY